MNRPFAPAGQRRARQHRRKFALAGRFVAAAAGQLHRMRRVEHHRTAERFHDRNRAHVGHEIVVAERRAAFGEQDFFRARRAAPSPRPGPFPPATGTGLFSGSRSGRSTAAASIKSVWRQRNAGICRMSTTSPAMAACVSVWTSVSTGTPNSARTLPRISRPASSPMPAKRFGGRAVGLVEAGLEDVENAERGAGFLERGGDLQAELFVFNHARPGDEKQPARRIEVFPDGGVVEHAEVLAAKRGKVNGP